MANRAALISRIDKRLQVLEEGRAASIRSGMSTAATDEKISLWKAKRLRAVREKKLIDRGATPYAARRKVRRGQATKDYQNLSPERREAYDEQRTDIYAKSLINPINQWSDQRQRRYAQSSEGLERIEGYQKQRSLAKDYIAYRESTPSTYSPEKMRVAYERGGRSLSPGFYVSGTTNKAVYVSGSHDPYRNAWVVAEFNRQQAVKDDPTYSSSAFYTATSPRTRRDSYFQYSSGDGVTPDQPSADWEREFRKGAGGQYISRAPRRWNIFTTEGTGYERANYLMSKYVFKKIVPSQSEQKGKSTFLDALGDPGKKFKENKFRQSFERGFSYTVRERPLDVAATFGALYGFGLLGQGLTIGATGTGTLATVSGAGLKAFQLGGGIMSGAYVGQLGRAVFSSGDPGFVLGAETPKLGAAITGYRVGTGDASRVGGYVRSFMIPEPLPARGVGQVRYIGNKDFIMKPTGRGAPYITYIADTSARGNFGKSFKPVADKTPSYSLAELRVFQEQTKAATNFRSIFSNKKGSLSGPSSRFDTRGPSSRGGGRSRFASDYFNRPTETGLRDTPRGPRRGRSRFASDYMNRLTSNVTGRTNKINVGIKAAAGLGYLGLLGPNSVTLPVSALGQNVSPATSSRSAQFIGQTPAQITGTTNDFFDAPLAIGAGLGTAAAFGIGFLARPSPSRGGGSSSPKPKTPGFPGWITPRRGGPSGRRAKGLGTGRGFGYSPSLYAIEFGVRGRAPRSPRGGFTGFELRPVTGKKRKRRKKARRL